MECEDILKDIQIIVLNTTQYSKIFDMSDDEFTTIEDRVKCGIATREEKECILKNIFNQPVVY